MSMAAKVPYSPETNHLDEEIEYTNDVGFKGNHAHKTISSLVITNAILNVCQTTHLVLW